MSLRIDVENIGGLRSKTLNLEKGVNRVRASNAVGKTSFTKAIELLVLSEKELQGKGNYANLFVGSEEPIKVKLSGEINHERRFRRIGQEDLAEVGTTPLISVNGRRIKDVCFAIPGNSLIEDFINGKGIGDYIELLAGSQNREGQELSNEISHELGIRQH